MFLSLEELTRDHKDSILPVWNSVCEIMYNGIHVANGFIVKQKLKYVVYTVIIDNVDINGVNNNNVIIRFKFTNEEYNVKPISVSTFEHGMYFTIDITTPGLNEHLCNTSPFSICDYNTYILNGMSLTFASIAFIDGEKKLIIHGNFTRCQLQNYTLRNTMLSGAPVFQIDSNKFPKPIGCLGIICGDKVKIFDNHYKFDFVTK